MPPVKKAARRSRGSTAGDEAGVPPASSTSKPPTALPQPAATVSIEDALQLCDGATTWGDLDAAFTKHVAPCLHALVHRPLIQPLADTVAPTSCCDPAVLEARSLAGKFDDVRLLTMRFASNFLKKGGGSGATAAGEKRGRSTKDTSSEAQRPDHVIANIYCMLYGLTFAPADDKGAALRFPFTVEEKRALERSGAYVNSNAAERRGMQLRTVLVLFSDRGRRAEFSALWSAFVARPVPGPLRLHFLTAVGTKVLPHMTRPVLLSDYLSTCFTHGGLTAVLALEGLFVLMLDHGLEYPTYYNQLYSLVTPNAFSSPHRTQLFRLVDLSLSSLRVGAYIVAGFIKRVARVLLLSPGPSMYFGLPFLRKLFQQHPNCLALIHRTEGAPELFEGKDPFKPFDNRLETCNAIDSTLWELAILERHYLPAVGLMVSAYASPAQADGKLTFEKTFGRLFAQELTKGKATDPGVISYKPPPTSGLLAPDTPEPILAGVFGA